MTVRKILTRKVMRTSMRTSNRPSWITWSPRTPTMQTPSWTRARRSSWTTAKRLREIEDCPRRPRCPSSRWTVCQIEGVRIEGATGSIPTRIPNMNSRRLSSFANGIRPISGAPIWTRRNRTKSDWLTSQWMSWPLPWGRARTLKDSSRPSELAIASILRLSVQLDTSYIFGTLLLHHTCSALAT